jgi:hypothetical protein
MRQRKAQLIVSEPLTSRCNELAQEQEDGKKADRSYFDYVPALLD